MVETSVLNTEILYHSLQLAGLYKGVLAPIVSAGLINATVFGVHGHVMERLQPDSRVPRLTNSFIAGSAGGLVSSFITCPTELIRIRMQMQGIGEREVFLEYTGHHSAPGAHKYYDSTWDCFKKVTKSEGVTGLYRGNLTTILRETPSFGCYFVTMDYFCHQSARYFDVHFDEVGPVTLFIGGGFSGMICWLISYPFDVVKSRLQCDGLEHSEYKGTMDCIRKTYHSAGIHGFFKGITPTLVRAFPVNATTWITAIMIKRLFSRQNL